jgi:hypothetical protein
MSRFVASITFALFAVLLLAAPSNAGIKLGFYIPQNSDYDPSFTVALDGRFRVTDQLRLGFELAVVPGLGGTEIGYDVGLMSVDYKTSKLLFESLTTGGWWYFTDHLYGGLGVGYYSTGPDAILSSPDPHTETPAGLIVQVSFGLMQKPITRKHFLFFGELAYRYCSGSGTLGSGLNGYVNVSGPSGVTVYAGLTF